MTMTSALFGGVGNIIVNTTQNRGLNAGEVAQRATEKIMSVGENANPLIRDQALAFQAHIRVVIEFYIKEAIKNDRATLAIRLREAGYPDLVTLLEK